MLASRKALLSNLNYVHLHHVSLGVHLSMHPEVTDTTMNQGTGVKDKCHHKWGNKEEVDPNSNDPSMPCQCCDQHPKQESLQYSSLEDLEAIICDECLSPDDLPLSPLSLSSPSTDSSSSSDFTLDDSPVSMCYKEYCQDGLDTPDQQPDIIPLDVATNGLYCLSPQKVETPNSNLSETNYQEITNNNMQADDTPFIDWDSDSILDSNSNTLIEKSGCSSLDSDTITELEHQTSKMGQDQWPEEQDLLPGLPFPENTAMPTPKKKTITSFHELAMRRRRSGGELSSQSKRDCSDWLIAFSPDTEHPPINELTVSAFDHGFLESQVHPLTAANEVTTFRELRYRNTLNKMSVQQIKVHEERSSMTSAEATTDPSPIGQILHGAREQKDCQQLLKTHDDTIGETNNQTQGSQRPKNPASRNGTDTNIPSRTDHKQSSPVNTLPRIKNKGDRYWKIPDKDAMPTAAVTWTRGLADGGDRRGQEDATTFASSQFLLPNSKLWPLYPPSLMSWHSFGPAQVPWYPGLPPRLSPVGASSPPHRALLPLMDSPDVAVLLSPLFPRKRTCIQVRRGHEAWCQVKTDTLDTAAECELLMAEETEDSGQRQKKTLLIAVGSSVEKIISHFNTSRNQVQKAQLGDSRLSPVLGYLILNHLCPSLYSLLGDGLKPYQKDVIIGRRRSSPWSLVEAATKTGPKTVHLLFSKVNHLPQLRDPQRKFNAFIFGLLNMKQLDVWVLHLHQIYDQISTFYLPSGFVALAATLHLNLRDELLLSLQPLSALTFHTDLLFEHHHLSLHDLPTPHRAHNPVSNNWAVPSLQNILDLGGWITHNLTGNAEKKDPSPNKGKSVDDADEKYAADGSQPDSVARAGDRPRSRDTFVHSETSSSDIDAKELLAAYNAESSQDLAPGNWKLTSWDPIDKESNHRASATKERDLQEQRFSEEIISGVAHKNMPRGTEHQKQEGTNVLCAAFTQGTSDGTCCSSGAESMKDATTMDSSRGQCLAIDEKGKWLGQLFGANSSHGRETEAKSYKSRRPSSWLLPNVNVWHLIRKQSTPANTDIFSQKEEMKDSSRPQRSLRALCDHSASAKTQLSFKKGDVLQLLGTVDEDWIQCRRGSDTGLVPVGYTSLIL
ncbi:AP-4 complex accessory subunit RUSC1 isoform X1 [Dendrobates tinctorius]|uniref:AP-4 complex accessory subunit RUSC1 isoform X1 n=1 Tax=Dendrobates tinctorius TaxID=92724 RepID=UPI003CCA2500